MKRSGRADALKLLGLARRAGAVDAGLEATRRAIREGRARLVLVADDASPAQLDKIGGLLEHRQVPRRIAADRTSLGAALGAPPLSAVAVTGEGFADSLLRLLPPGDGGRGP